MIYFTYSFRKFDLPEHTVTIDEAGFNLYRQPSKDQVGV